VLETPGIHGGDLAAARITCCGVSIWTKRMYPLSQ
jgi:hypothetical protein